MAGTPDAVVVGSGPNGLAAAITLAQAGRSVHVLEAAGTAGGGARSEELTLPGFIHDVCSAVFPFGAGSPFFRSLPLAHYGLEWIHPPAALAHPFDDGTAVLLEASVESTAAGLGVDAEAYRRLMLPLAAAWPRLETSVLGPLRMPSHPFALAGFGLRAFRSARGTARRVFAGERARALFGGIAAHGMLPLDQPLTAGFGFVLALMAHISGWPLPRGGAQAVPDALAAHLRSLGGGISTGVRVRSIDDFSGARAILCDLSPKPLLRIAGHRFPDWYRRKLEGYRYGPGVFKADWALDGPVPWSAAECARAATVHVGGRFAEIAEAEREVWEGRHPDRPFILLVQPTLFDPSRAPGGKHTVWAYCHVPNGSGVDMLGRIEAQIERFAPGFRERVIARSVMLPCDIERRNPNFVGGDIGSGLSDLVQFFARPTLRTYTTPLRGVYICSAAAPPGVGVHGMCGYFAARRALADVLGG